VAQYWALIAAAGSGRRMAAVQPKQYLRLLGKTVLEHSLDRLLALPRITGATLVLSADDDYWDALDYRPLKPLWRAEGGRERVHSVFKGLQQLAEYAAADDWVLVHDAARPCVRPADLEHLCDTLADDAVGGLLAVPVKDTLKQSDAQACVTTTLDRSALWHAQTPQMFRLGLLRQALAKVLQQGEIVTDEAGAVERLGQHVRLVAGHYDNIKITTREDLLLAEYFLSQQLARSGQLGEGC